VTLSVDVCQTQQLQDTGDEDTMEPYVSDEVNVCAVPSPYINYESSDARSIIVCRCVIHFSEPPVTFIVLRVLSVLLLASAQLNEFLLSIQDYSEQNSPPEESDTEARAQVSLDARLSAV
jgi:hypothetical protein